MKEIQDLRIEAGELKKKMPKKVWDELVAGVTVQPKDMNEYQLRNFLYLARKKSKEPRL